jgi:hypothetical protein
MLTAPEREAVRVILKALSLGEWPKGVCPRCACSQLRGHKCSCPVKRATKLLNRAVGQAEPAIEDEDLIVESAMRDLVEATNLEGRRRILWDAVEAAMQLGARS